LRARSLQLWGHVAVRSKAIEPALRVVKLTVGHPKTEKLRD
jgi:hypothetical protein